MCWTRCGWRVCRATSTPTQPSSHAATGCAPVACLGGGPLRACGPMRRPALLLAGCCAGPAELLPIGQGSARHVPPARPPTHPHTHTPPRAGRRPAGWRDAPLCRDAGGGAGAQHRCVRWGGVGAARSGQARCARAASPASPDDPRCQVPTPNLCPPTEHPCWAPSRAVAVVVNALLSVCAAVGDADAAVQVYRSVAWALNSAGPPQQFGPC